jgi:hypothetical protein
MTVAQVRMFWVIIVAGIIFLPTLAMAVWREWLVYNERVRWVYEHPVPKRGEPDYWRKIELTTAFHALLQAVSQDEMVLKFWVPIQNWKAIAQGRVDSAKDKMTEELAK